ncbi:MAG TPA: helix-turn-helix domain-containing protein [Chitinophagaceae bacterium]|jgi:hypothetical protein
MENNELQQVFFQHIKSKLPSHLSLVDEVADLLDISNDSAYRRIRGEKQVTFEEIQKLSDRFKISLDQVLNLKNDSMTFSGNFIEADSFNFMNYLDDIVYKNLLYISSFKQKELFYFSKDIPAFYYFMFPELSAFKFFFWMKTVFNFPVYSQKKFNVKKIETEFFERAKKLAIISCQIPSSEILNVENFQITLRQIEYYKDTGLFESKEELELLYNKLHEMVDHMECMCSAGRKFLPGQKALKSDAALKMYVNDFIIGDNSFIAVVDDRKMCFVNHTTVNLMLTQDEKFCNYSYDCALNIIRKSNLISEVGERERTMFFNQARHRIDLYKQNEIKTLSKMTPYY